MTHFTKEYIKYTKYVTKHRRNAHTSFTVGVFFTRLARAANWKYKRSKMRRKNQIQKETEQLSCRTNAYFYIERLTFNVWMVSSWTTGEIVQMMDVFAFPPSEFCKIRVSLQSRYGTCLQIYNVIIENTKITRMILSAYTSNFNILSFIKSKSEIVVVF